MSFALLLPAGLAALAALLLPLLIHLARRSEQRITDFAALRWLAARPQPRRKRRFEEWWLLLLRLLLLAALALLLAQPVLYGRPDRTPWIVAAPGIAAAQLRAAAGDGNARLHWLAHHFPGIDHPPPTGPQPLASLLRELDARLPAGAPLTVLVPPVIDGADAERPKLVRRVDWRIVPGATPPATLPPAPAVMPQLAVRYAKEREPSLRYLRAAGAAWRAGMASKRAEPAAAPASPITIAGTDQALPPKTRNLVWLAPGPLPAKIRDWIAGGGVALLDAEAKAPQLDGATVLWRDTDGEPLVRGQALGRGRILQLARPLTPAAMPQLLDADFPQRLRALFVAAPRAPTRVDAAAYRPVAGASPHPEAPRPLAPWLAALVALLFLLERWLASGPRRGGAS